MGRKKLEVPDDRLPEVEQLAAVLSLSQLADFLGMSPRTFQNRRDENPELDASYKRGRANALAKVGGSLLKQALNGNTTAQMFYLKTQGGWRETATVEHTGAGGGPIEVQTDELRRTFTSRIAGIASRVGAGSAHSGTNGRGT